MAWTDGVVFLPRNETVDFSLSFSKMDLEVGAFCRETVNFDNAGFRRLENVGYCTYGVGMRRMHLRALWNTMHLPGLADRLADRAWSFTRASLMADDKDLASNHRVEIQTRWPILVLYFVYFNQDEKAREKCFDPNYSRRAPIICERAVEGRNNLLWAVKNNTLKKVTMKWKQRKTPLYDDCLPLS